MFPSIREPVPCALVSLATVLGLVLGTAPRLAEAEGTSLAAAEGEVRRLRIHNLPGGVIEVSLDRGKSWRKVGHVVRPIRGVLKDIQDREFTAADWAPMGSVAASAVNAIHVKVGQADHARIFTLQPGDFLKVEEGYEKVSYFHSPSSIYTDIAAGEGIFRDLAPRVGDPVEREVDGGLEPWPEDRAPRIGDRIVFRVHTPATTARWIEFENRFGGRIQSRSRTGGLTTLGQVLRPVTGVGRFAGTKYADVGEIRANHPGVVCISTSPVGQIGGLQIVPARHASEDHLAYVRTKSVWMVVGPPGLLQDDLEGRAPLFRGQFLPRQGPVQVRLSDGEWQTIPEAVGLKEGALLAVTHLRISNP